MSPVQIGPTITSGYHGTCSFCLKEIRPGDLICNVDLTWAHEFCVDRELDWSDE